MVVGLAVTFSPVEELSDEAGDQENVWLVRLVFGFASNKIELPEHKDEVAGVGVKSGGFLKLIFTMFKVIEFPLIVIMHLYE